MKEGDGSLEREKEPLITVAIPIYKAQYYLRRCVDSVLSQTYKNLQVILVDDGSPDASPQICDEYVGKDKRIFVIHKRNGGVSSARNAALDLAQGEFIVFVDSDDCVAPDLVEQLLTTYRQFGRCISICAVTRKSGELCTGLSLEGTVYTPQEALRVLTLLEKERPRFEGWSVSKLFERSLFSGLRFPEGVPVGEDLAIMYRLFDRAEKIVFVDSAKYFYFNNPNGVINEDFSKKNLLGILEVWEGFLEFVKKKYPKLENCVKDRAAMGAVNYYYYISCCSYTGQDVSGRLLDKIREDMPGLLCRKHPFSYKWRAFWVVLCPHTVRIIVNVSGKCKNLLWKALKNI